MSSINSELVYIREKVDEISKSTTKNEEHLRAINGTLLRHQKSIECHRKKINKLNYYLGYGFGAISVLVLILNLLL